MNIENLSLLRYYEGLTQDEMAKILDVSRAAVSKWENGVEIIPLDKLNIYSNYFKVDIDYILGLTNNKTYNAKRKNLNLNIIKKRLTYIRKKEKLTQNELATILNTSHSSISNYENGKVLIKTDYIYTIAKKYNYSIDWIIGKFD